MVKSRKQAISVWAALGKFPPYYVRLLAKRPGSGQQREMAITNAEIAIASGIPLSRVMEISRMKDWAFVTIGELLTFTIACNFDPTNPRDRQRATKYDYICQKRKTLPFGWVRRSPKWESEFLPLLQILKSSLTSSRTSASAESLPATKFAA